MSERMWTLPASAQRDAALILTPDSFYRGGVSGCCTSGRPTAVRGKTLEFKSFDWSSGANATPTICLSAVPRLCSAFSRLRSQTFCRFQSKMSTVATVAGEELKGFLVLGLVLLRGSGYREPPGQSSGPSGAPTLWRVGITKSSSPNWSPYWAVTGHAPVQSCSTSFNRVCRVRG